MRALPETKEQWEEFKVYFLKTYKDAEDTPETWTFVLSQLQGVKMPELEFNPKDIWKHYKRWKIAKVLQDEKTVYIRELENKLMELMKVQEESNGSSSDMSIGTQSVSGELPELQETSENVVSIS